MPAHYRLFTTASNAVTPHYDDGLAVSAAGTYYGNAVSLQRAMGASVQLLWDGTPTGAWTLWMTNKNQPNLANDNDWTQYTDAFVDPVTTTDLATLDLGTLTSTHLDTVIKAKSAGGKDITVQGVDDATGAVTLVEDTVARTVVIHYKGGTSTVTNVETAIATSTLIAVKTAGTGATVLAAGQGTFAATPLTGGNRSTADELGNFRAGYFRIKYVHASGTGTLYGYAQVNRI